MVDEDGVVIAVMVTNAIDDGGQDIFYLAVDPARQGSGLGQTLLDFATSRGWPRITAKARPANQRVAAVLERKGFQHLPNETDKYWVYFEWRRAL